MIVTMIATAIVRIARTIAIAVIATMRKFVAAAMTMIVIAMSVNTWRLCAHTAQRQSASTMSLTQRN